jgi:hypothetical protein
MRLRFALPLCLAALPFPAQAFTAEELFRQCSELVRAWENPNAQFKAVQSGRCVGYISGVVDLNELAYQDRHTGGKPRFCPPDRLGNEQVVRIVHKHLKDNPSLLHFSAVSQVLLALTRAFPCH